MILNIQRVQLDKEMWDCVDKTLAVNKTGMFETADTVHYPGNVRNE